MLEGVRCSSVVRVFAHGAMGHQIDPSCWRERDVALVRVFAHGAMGHQIDPSCWRERDVALW